MLVQKNLKLTPGAKGLKGVKQFNFDIFLSIADSEAVTHQTELLTDSIGGCVITATCYKSSECLYQFTALSIIFQHIEKNVRLDQVRCEGAHPHS